MFPQHGQFGGQKGASLLWPLGGGPESMRDLDIAAGSGCPSLGVVRALDSMRTVTQRAVEGPEDV